ncbi:UvrD-helicase domain-containing protein [Usitatibacter palustris]|uniref:DNA 3'-5' helicase n=1 Tax=Usitatibacter palustris TaxID=2732487 RepID=A0A6M4H661_9PROT|nr:UvrD-helicase domain-containing protein [Usitatibacter palustris]QJR13387.1 DNA helicase II [Usitatibacter palustris]
MGDYLANLNPEQLKAVTLPRESALILAGAGSGKTRVLTTRIAHLIQSGQASPAGILAVTFTNKAAKEMLTRLSAMLPINVRGMWVGTFHGICNRLLRTHHRDAALPQLFQILDSGDQQSLIKRLAKSQGMDDEKFPPRQMQNFINNCKEAGLRANAVEAGDDFTRRMVAFYADYDAQCNREGVVDFAELLLRTFELLAKNLNLLTHYQERFKYILVDEFQDTNKLQYKWIKMLAGSNGCVFAVGDDDQSIYRFRGAEVGNMNDFVRDFAVEHVVKLEQNYRSQGHILDAANAIIAKNKARLGKNLWTSEGKGEQLRVFAAATDSEEAQYIVDEVKQLHREGMPMNEIALLYRSNAQSRVLEHALFRARLPYKVYGGLRFFERMEVKHALAYLRLAGNPDDDSAFTRVVNFPARGVGARSVEQLQEAVEQGIKPSLMSAARAGVVSGRSGTAIAQFIAIIDLLRTASENLRLPELIEEVLERSNLAAHYAAERDGQDRVENLHELVNAATLFAEEFEHGETPAGEAEADVAPVGTHQQQVLAAFLSHASLEAGEHEAAAGADALQLMTVHSSKGLEFHAVFVSGLEEGLFPHDNSMNEDGGLEEERRLMYVAITRARKRLYVTYAGTRMLHGQPRYGMVSRFVDEIPAELCKWIVLPERAQTRWNSGASSNSSWGSGGGRAPQADPDRYATAPRAKFELERPDAHPFAIGQNVQHAKFGEGVVLNFEGRGLDARIQVRFKTDGTKWLALQYAKLTAA